MTTADVAIVGAGGLGLSVAHQLGRRGARVVVVDRAEPGSQTSAQAAGHSVLAHAVPEVTALMRRSIALLDALPVALHRVGSLELACGEPAAAALRREVETTPEIEPIAVDDAARLAPHLDLSGVQAAAHVPEELYFRPPELLSALLATAGAEIRSWTEARGFETSGGRVTGVATANGPIAAGAVVVAAGPWSGPLLARAGVSAPLRLVRHQLSIRGPVPGVHPELPIVRVMDHDIYARPEGDALLLGAYEPAPPEAEPDELELDPAPIQRVVDAVDPLFPAAPLIEMRGGVVSLTPDERYIVDEAMPGLYVACGCNVRGLATAPALGEDIATWITSGRRPDALRPFALSRFGAPGTGDC